MGSPPWHLGCLWAHSDLAVASRVSARLTDEWYGHPPRHTCWGRAIFEGKMMNFIDDVELRVPVRHPSRDGQGPAGLGRGAQKLSEGDL